MINVGVSSGLFFIKGFILLFISYGGSSLIIIFLMMVLVMWVDYENDNIIVEL